MILKLLLINTLVALVTGANFQITNKEGGPIWVGIQGNTGHPALNGGGFQLNKGQTKNVGAPDNWAGRFWARTWCNPSSKHCETGDCGNKLQCNGAGGVSPATLLEIALKQHAGLDFYDVSLVDGFNIPASIEPVGGRGVGGKYGCTKAACPTRINGKCPGELQLKHNNQVIGCKSACARFNTDQYCCRGAHRTPQTCKSSSWPHNYPAFFKRECPDAYSYAYDDHKSTFKCKASTYKIVFG